jgi:hypothetical protein
VGPESLIVECDCGAEPSLTASTNTCAGCGADYRGIVEKVLEARPEDKVEHPWRSLRPYYTATKGTWEAKLGAYKEGLYE